MREWVDLSELSPQHKLRNTPLIEIEAEYKSYSSTVWCKVQPAYGIAKKTFNQLSGVWYTWDEWRAPLDMWDEDRIDRIGQNGNEGLHYE